MSNMTDSWLSGVFFSRSKYSKTRFRLGRHPGARWGASAPDPLVGWGGGHSHVPLPNPFLLDVSISAPLAPRLSGPPTQIPGYGYGKARSIVCLTRPNFGQAVPSLRSMTTTLS